MTPCLKFWIPEFLAPCSGHLIITHEPVVHPPFVRHVTQRIHVRVGATVIGNGVAVATEGA